MNGIETHAGFGHHGGEARGDLSVCEKISETMSGELVSG